MREDVEDSFWSTEAEDSVGVRGRRDSQPSAPRSRRARRSEAPVVLPRDVEGHERDLEDDLGQGTLRNLDQIQEADSERALPGAVRAAFLLLGGACVTFAILALTGHKSKPDAPKMDPLGELVKERAAGIQAKPEITPKDVTFPSILSDSDKPTTALAAVRAENRAPTPTAQLPAAAPPPPTDMLPVVPLPAQHVLQASPVVTRPRDVLTKAASDSAQLASDSATPAPSGREGGYQLQVSSFREENEAKAFAEQLRARGHKAYVAEARVQGRGTWYRVRVGPFATQTQAAQYRVSFEAKEHVVPFIVTPPAPK